MSVTTADAKALAHAHRHRTSLHKQRLWALWGSYIALGFFVIIFLVPPFYTLMTSLKSSAEISAQTGSPWLVHHPTLENFWYLITYPNFQTYYLNSVMITIGVVLNRSSLRSRTIRSKPPISGISRSVTTRSYLSWRAI